ncbi:MAG: hypothetical protein PVI11_07960 [Candidatus Aminicenantes bacterium]|jgi:hypothetical protein
MKVLFDLFTSKERKILGLLCLLLGLALVFYAAVGLGMKRSYYRSLDILSAAKRDLQSAESSRTKKESESSKWIQAQEDIQELRQKYFYTKEDWVKELRIDIQRILDESRIQYGRKKYDYVLFEKENIKKVHVDFSVTGRYASLKRFIHAVENFPKFLLIERIDFQDIDPQGRGIKLRIQLAGYYAIP